MKLGNKFYTRKELEKRIGNLSQIGGTRHYQLNEGRSKGVSAIDVNTGCGFRFTILPDRGLDISSAIYKGMNLVYLTPNGEVNPAFYEPRGLGWLRTFFGGLLTTCGLTYLGQPCKDGDEELGLHGRYSTTPARQVSDRSTWKGDDYYLEVSGIVEECSLFGDKIRLTRTISTRIGAKSLNINDIVENFGYKEAPFTILYHINAGFPLLDKSSELILSAIKTEPYDDISRAGIEKMTKFSAPVSGFKEQNYLHKMAGDRDGYGYAGMINKNLGNGLGLYIRFDTQNLPYLSEWKMMGEGDYVAGIEPCNVKCESRSVLRKNRLLPFLKPGQVKEIKVEIGILEGEKEIEAFTSKIKEILKSRRKK